MRVLITGGSGFVGSHLAQQRLIAGHTVTVVDDLSTGRMANIEHLTNSARFHHRIESCLNRSLMAELVDQADEIYHLAAAVGVKLIVERPIYTIETNIKLTEILLDLAAKRSTPTLLASTSEVYGKLDRFTFTERDDLVLGPTTSSRWCYAASKIVDEFLALAYYKSAGLPVVITRLFNTVGPRQSPQYGMVLPRFVQQALRGDDLTVYGDGTQRRAFTWVGDVVDAMTALMGHLTPGSRVPPAGEVFNIGHPEDIAIRDLAALVIERTQSRSKVVYIPFTSVYGEGFEDMPRRLPNVTKLQGFIGYKPTLSLPAIIDRVVEEMR